MTVDCRPFIKRYAQQIGLRPRSENFTNLFNCSVVLAFDVVVKRLISRFVVVQLSIHELESRRVDDFCYWEVINVQQFSHCINSSFFNLPYLEWNLILTRQQPFFYKQQCVFADWMCYQMCHSARWHSATFRRSTNQREKALTAKKCLKGGSKYSEIF